VRPLILASIIIVVVVLGAVAVAVVIYNPFASLNTLGTNGTSCTVTTTNSTSESICPIGNNLYLANLGVLNSSFSNHPTYLIVLVINNTGTAPVNITTINFDNGPVNNTLPSPGSTVTSPFWQSYTTGHVISSKSELPFTLVVPRTVSRGLHKITLVDSAGKSYTFSFNL
jgi:hypothetical protein